MNYLKLNERDTVVVALKDFQPAEKLLVDDHEIVIQDTVLRGHKIAITKTETGNDVIKYGFPIGHASKSIEVGSLVHKHNMKTNLNSTKSYKDFDSSSLAKKVEKKVDRFFKGYRRDEKHVGIRNEIWIINTVGCINKVAENLAKIASQKLQHDNFHGFYNYSHPFGCSQLGDDLNYTQKILARLVEHPNAAGVLVIGLGCENNHLNLFKPIIDQSNKPIQFLQIQDIEDEMEVGLDILTELFNEVITFEREDIPLSELKIGMKCGGSDAFSGITANPLLGRISDEVISNGGYAALTEVPEMFGAEQILLDRAQNEQVHDSIVQLINDFKNYFMKYDQPIYENPSPGNNAGGITTLEEKSLGCVQKGGTSIVRDVIGYGETIENSGLTLIQGPGNDQVSVTALAASGCQMVLFSTGRGTPFGGPVPTLKIATNSELSQKKKSWIDFNAGRLLEGQKMEDLTEQLLDLIIRTANGEYLAKNEKYGFKEISIFKDGVTM